MEQETQQEPRLDTWASTLLNLGQALTDKLGSVSYTGDVDLTPQELDSLYHGNDLAAKICNAIPEDATRQGWGYEGLDEDLVKAVNERWVALDAVRHLTDSWIWGRLYGGGLLLLGVDDGRDPAEPLSEKPAPLRYLKDVDCRYVRVDRKYKNPREEHYNEPEVYAITDPFAADGTVHYHASRVVRFGGARTSSERKAKLQGWDCSVLQRVYGVLRSFGVAWESVGRLMVDASMVVYKRKGLAQMVAAGQEATVQQRLQLLEAGRSIARALLIDMDDEAIDRSTIDMAGYPPLLDRFFLRMAAAAEMPIMILFGQSPSGLAASGDAEIRWYYDRVKHSQTTTLVPAVRTITDIILRGLASGKAVPEYTVKPEPLWNMSAKEEAELDKTRSETIGNYLDRQVFAPEEVSDQVAGELDLTIDPELHTPIKPPPEDEGGTSDDKGQHEGQGDDAQ